MPADLLIRIRADDAGTRGALKGITESIEDVGKSSQQHSSLIGGLGDVLGKVGLAAMGIQAGIGVATGAVQGLIGPALDAQKVTAQLQSVLASTGGKAGVTQEAVENLSNALSKVTPFEDEAITSGQSLLLTFTNIGQDVFPQATETMLDMSQALGQDLKSSSIQLGKALNDPIKGITALTRVGVSFTEEQKDQIKAMVEAGDVAGAQAVILKELQTEFGGAAKAAGQTFAGQLTILQTQLGNVVEAIGGPLLKVLSQLLTQLMPIIQAFADWLPGAIDDFMTSVQDLWEQLKGVRDFISHDVLPILRRVGDFIMDDVVPAVRALAVQAQRLLGDWQDTWSGHGGVWDTMQTVWDFLQPVFAAIGAELANFSEELLPEFQKTWEVVSGRVQEAWKDLMRFLQPAIDAFARFWEAHHDTILHVLDVAWQNIQDIVRIAWDVVKTIILVGLDLIQGDWQGAWDHITENLGDAWQRIKDIVGRDIGLLGEALAAGWAGIRQAASDAWNGLADAVTGAFRGIVAPIQGVINQVLGLFKPVQDAIAALQNFKPPTIQLPTFGSNLASIAAAATGGGGGGSSAPAASGSTSTVANVSNPNAPGFVGFAALNADPNLASLPRNPDGSIKTPPPGYRQWGGRVYAGQGYVVGEMGPEYFVPNQNGTVVPNGGGGIDYDKLAAALARVQLAVRVDDVHGALLRKQRGLATLGFR